MSAARPTHRPHDLPTAAKETHPMTALQCPLDRFPSPTGANRRRPPFLALVGAVAALVLLAASPALAATPAPAWSIIATSQPTNFAPGATATGAEFRAYPQYSLVATNIGGAITSGPITVTDTLPAGLTPVSASSDYRGGENSGTEASCTVTGQTVTCVDPAPLPSGAWLRVAIGLDVAPGASGVLVDYATVSGGAAARGASTLQPTTISPSVASFGFLPGAAGLSDMITSADGAAVTQAGSHPYQLTLEAGFPSFRPATELTAAGHLRDLRFDLPRGLIVNPQATPVLCTETQLENDIKDFQEGLEIPGCPVASQVGLVTPTTVTGGRVPQPSPLYNMVPPPGTPAAFGFDALGVGVYVHAIGGVRTGSDYGLSAISNDILARGPNPILSVQAQLWGDPSDPSHDRMRGGCVEHPGQAGGGTEICSAGYTATTPFLTMPSACSGPLVTGGGAESYESPGVLVGDSSQTTDTSGNPVGVSGCDRLDFTPTIGVRPEVSLADSPTGLKVDLHVPQGNESLAGLAEANLKKAVVRLPAGVAVSPSAANGLAACSSGQIELNGPSAANCPDAAKIGAVEVITPLLDHPLPGAIYIAAPYDNPFNSLLAIYIAVYDPQTGVVIKLAGHVEADPATGQLTTTFDENPELPFEDFKLEFFGGSTAALKTPDTCGAFNSESQLSPWSGTAPVSSTEAFAIAAGPNGGGCPAGLAGRRDDPSFSAGTVNPSAGRYSPFVLHMGRADGSQELRSINATLPPGLTGKLAGVPYCTDANVAAAAGRTGIAERSAPSCPTASQVGSATVGAGPGPNPYYVAGKAYLTGPYKGAPISLAIITPAVAGPFDLGTVVVRAALYVNPITAQIRAVSEPLPTILQGIPLDLRSINLSMDRPEFTLNPTSCEPMSVGGEAISLFNQVAPLSSRFQVGGCQGLPFKPKLALRVFGKTNRNAKPRFRAVLQTKPGEANIARAQVNLPHSEFLEQGHIKTICTRVQFNAGAAHGEQCPKNSIYGRAKAFTPLLENPLQGPVYLRSSSHKLPDLVAALNGQIDIALAGKVDSGPNAGLRNTFEVVPDAPVSKFILEMKGGKKGLLVNSENLCAKKAKTRGIVRFTGQNGAVESFKPRVANSCGKHKHRKASHK